MAEVLEDAAQLNYSQYEYLDMIPTDLSAMQKATG